VRVIAEWKMCREFEGSGDGDVEEKEKTFEPAR